MTNLRERIDAVSDADDAYSEQLAELATVERLARHRASQIMPTTPFPEDPAQTGRLDDDYLDRYLAAEADQARCEHQRTILRDVGNRAHFNAEQIRRTPRYDADSLRQYAKLLPEVMERARALAPDLAGIHTADEAFKQGKDVRWRQALDLANDYAALRSGQLRACRVERIHPPFDRVDDHVDDRFIRDLDARWDQWWRFDRHPTRGKVSTPFEIGPPRLEPWPADATARLMWFAEHPDWELWVPTDQQIEQLRRRRAVTEHGAKARPDKPAPTTTKYVDARNPNIARPTTPVEYTPTLTADEIAALTPARS